MNFESENQNYYPIITKRSIKKKLLGIFRAITSKFALKYETLYHIYTNYISQKIILFIYLVVKSTNTENHMIYLFPYLFHILICFLHTSSDT